MSETSVTKVDSDYSPCGGAGQKYLASSTHMGMRLWERETPGALKPSVRREYETIGYVLAGTAELHVEGQLVRLEQGDSYVVPRGAEHSYRILETFSAVEANYPPAQVHGRDQ